MQRIKLNLLRLDYLLGTAIIFCQVSGRYGLTSLFFFGTFLVTFLLWFCTLAEKVETLDIIAIFIIFTAFINIAINGLMEGASFSFEYIKKYIMFCCTIIFFAAAIKIEIENKTVVFLECLYVCIGLLLVFMYFLKSREMHLLRGYYTKYLTFRFTNPNLTAMFLASMIMFLIGAGFREKRTFWKCLLFLLAAAEVVFLYQTFSRNSLLAIAVFLFLSLFQFFKRRELKLKSWVLWLITAAPLLFALLYMEIVQSLSFTKMFAFIVSEGKDLDSRTFIWNRALSAFKSSPVIGAYCQSGNGTGLFQMHNSHIDIMTSYGVTVLLLTCVFLYGLMRAIQKKSQSCKQNVALVGFACSIFLGVGEAAVFSGGLGIYLFAGVFLLIQKQSTESTYQL